jgi:FxsC-like protein
VLYFFLSYARGNDDIYVKQFYQDLCNEVRVLVGARDDDVGFLDNLNIDPGQHWPQALVDAVAECASFLALYSPAYFLSRPCGKEWTLFARRSQEHVHEDSAQLSGLIPVVWHPPRELPGVARSLQYDLDLPDAAKEAYARRGLRQLLRLQRHKDDYLELVSAVADRIVEAAASPPPPGSREIEFEQLESAFHLDSASADDDATDLTSLVATGQTIHFVTVALSRVEAESIHRSSTFYGDRPHDWAPFRPLLPRPLGEYAQKVASEQGFRSTVKTVEQLNECLKLAQQQNHIVVLLIDAWSAELQRYRRMLEDFDHQDNVAAVLIVMSHNDPETQRRSHELADRMRRTLLNTERRLDEVMLRRSVLTGPSFEADLQVVLAEARNRLIKSGRVFRHPPHEPPGPRPILEGP